MGKGINYRKVRRFKSCSSLLPKITKNITTENATTENATIITKKNKIKTTNAKTNTNHTQKNTCGDGRVV